jgi:hypothetical protein
VLAKSFEVPCRHMSLMTERFRRFEISQQGEFWISQPQCPYGNLPPEANIVRERVRQNNPSILAGK